MLNVETMTNQMKRTSWFAAVAMIMLAAGGCDTDLDLTNPNATREEEVLSTPEGILSVAVGLQATNAGSVQDLILPSALVTDEWGTKTGALPSYNSLLDGEGFSSDFLVVAEPWDVTYGTLRAANNLIEFAPDVGLDTATATGVVALAKLFKAMALGTAIQLYEEVPIDVSVEAPIPQPRSVVLDTVLANLQSARQALAGMSDDDLALLRNRVLGDGFDLHNTIDAMLARYYLIDGQYQAAIDAAGRVDLGVLSEFSYVSPDANPVYNLSFELNYVAGLASFADAAVAGDERVEYWVETDPAQRFSGIDSMLVALNKYSSRSAAFPVYLPDEMRLIQAEAYTRLGQFGPAAGFVNDVHTQCGPVLDEPAACLPTIPSAALDTEPELLAQIAYERRYELYMQGLRWEDMRRLDDVIATEPVFEYFPIPRQECLPNEELTC